MNEPDICIFCPDISFNYQSDGQCYNLIFVGSFEHPSTSPWRLNLHHFVFVFLDTNWSFGCIMSVELLIFFAALFLLAFCVCIWSCLCLHWHEASLCERPYFPPDRLVSRQLITFLILRTLAFFEVFNRKNCSSCCHGRRRLPGL